MDDNLKKFLINVEAAPPMKAENLTDYTKISLGKAASFGMGFSALTNSLAQQSANVGSFPLYRAVNASGAPMRLPNMISDGLGYSTGYYNGEGLAVARMQEVGSTANPAANIPYNPMMLFMSVALISVEKNLDEIQETQKQILMFMEEDKRSKLQGNLKFLSDVMNNYKYNLDNKTYKDDMRIKALDIKQEAGQNVIFYQSKINKALDKQKLFISDQNITHKMDKLQSDFEDLRFAIYSFGFSSFLEAMLRENFNPEYLNGIAQRIRDYAFEYKELYTVCYNYMENGLKSSVQNQALKGLGEVSALAGNAVGKIPKIDTSKVEEFLTDSGTKLKNKSLNRPEETMKKFIHNKDCFVNTFVENINTVNNLYNKPVDCLFDSENLYVKVIEE